MSVPRDVASRLRQRVWEGSIPLEIRLNKGDSRSYDGSEPYLIHLPRVSYLGLLLQRLHAFFARDLIYPDVAPTEGWLSFEHVPLKWHYPIGVLYDLYSGAEPTYPSDPDADNQVPAEEIESLPWKLTVHYSDYPIGQMIKLDKDGKHLHDLYINSVKEADMLRNGNAKTIMSMPLKDSEQLWESIKDHSFPLFNPINQKLLNPQGMDLRNVPLRLYVPHRAADTIEEEPVAGSIRVVQTPIPLSISSRQPQTIGTALNQLLPNLFPSPRTALLAQPVLHGAVLPMNGKIEEVLKTSAYSDGWLHIAIVMMG
ncbi:autophagy protein 5 [Lophiotrema nucula]|uniref:Autophagy protein 5 n=1 Tax=Lophiotrema nucula TaxID=690887 RepID=A0A6A5YPR9_9PLEO|nr:autophagy protein 5 [Lophiotrema nucula]